MKYAFLDLAVDLHQAGGPLLSAVDRWKFGGRPFPGNLVNFLILSSAVDRYQPGGQLLPYFSAIFTSTND